MQGRVGVSGGRRSEAMTRVRDDWGCRSTARSGGGQECSKVGVKVTERTIGAARSMAEVVGWTTDTTTVLCRGGPRARRWRQPALDSTCRHLCGLRAKEREGEERERDDIVHAREPEEAAGWRGERTEDRCDSLISIALLAFVS